MDQRDYVTQGNVSAQRPKDIPDSLSTLHSIVSDLLEAARSLEQKLTPIVRGVPVGPSAEKDIPYAGCEVACQIQDANLKLGLVRRQIESLTSAVEL